MEGEDEMTKINEAVKLMLDIAEVVDRDGEKEEYTLPNKLRLGYRALSGKLRDGACEIVKMQERYSDAIITAELAKIGEEDAQKMLEDVLGEEDAETLCDEIKEKIKNAVAAIIKEWDEEHMHG